MGFSVPASYGVDVLVVGIEVVVGSVVDVVVVDVVVVDVVVVVGGGVSQPVTQNTLCFTSALCDPSLLTVSLTRQPCWGCGPKPVRSSVYVSEASSPASDPPSNVTCEKSRTLRGAEAPGDAPATWW
jgi:hypothetical protein